MEKYSAWRDASTGVLPFVLPVSPNSDSRGPAAILLVPLLCLVAAVRTALFLVLVGLYTVFELFFNATADLPWFRQGIAFLCLRTTLLLCFGYYWIDEESTSLVRRSAGSHVAVPKLQDRKTLVLANLSSPVDAIYLALRCQPVFAKPYASAKDRTIGFKACTLLSFLRSMGKVPELHTDDAKGIKSLDDLLAGSRRPVLLFPEGTSSNNRGLLRCLKIKQIGQDGTRVHIVALRHDAPSTWLDTATQPLPDNSLSPLPSLARVFLSPPFIPRHLAARWLVPAEAPRAGMTDFLAKCQSALCQAGKLKQLSLGWEEKQSFLEYHRKGKPARRR